MCGSTIDRYVPDRERVYQRKSDAPRRSSTFSSMPIRNAVPSSSSYNGNRQLSRRPSSNDTPVELDTSLPKNFSRPLTCHFWYHNGRCTKRDIDCAYAHYNTGFISGAPITPPGASEALAGKNIDRYTEKLDTHVPLLADVQKRELSVAECEAELKECQRALRRREDDVEDWESAVSRREIEVDDKERIVNRMSISLARKSKELKILAKSVARREEALREKGF